MGQKTCDQTGICQTDKNIGKNSTCIGLIFSIYWAGLLKFNASIR